MAFRNNAQTKQTYEGGPVEITLEFWDVAYRVKEGSSIRVDISSSNFPEYSVHPNTEVLWSEATEVEVAHQKILAGSEYPSRIILPIDEAE